MKKQVLSIAVAILVNSLSFANDTAYKQAMAKQLQAFGQAASAEDLKEVANAFDRIARMNEKEWLPDYYAALCLVNAGFRSEDSKTKDAFFTQAQKRLNLVIKAHGENSEIIALRGFSYLGELSVDPQIRGQHLSQLVMEELGKALAMNPENPRAMIMMAQMQLGMAKFFGSGPEKACGMAEKSVALFEKEANTENKNPFAPTWGKDMAEKMVAQCN